MKLIPRCSTTKKRSVNTKLNSLCRNYRVWDRRKLDRVRVSSLPLPVNGANNSHVNNHPTSKQYNLRFSHTSNVSNVFNCGELNKKNVGSKVTLRGWVSSDRYIGKVRFIALRDGFGTTQIKIEEGSINYDWSKSGASAEFLNTDKFPLESVVEISGTVISRPSEMINSNMSTGEIEVEAAAFSILNIAENIPILYHREESEASELKRLEYRYLDLRQPDLQYNIRLRSRITKATRDYMYSKKFNEIETPTLFKSTPEGAREFLVATRIPGKFYSLPQSPQQYKQLLMASGFERYFQIARCYRDESGRKDRQPEFTQVDIEMAFITQEDIMNVVEGLVVEIWKTAGFPVEQPILRMKYKDAILNYGTDRPDLRFGFLIQDISKCFENTSVTALKPPATISNSSASHEFSAYSGFSVRAIKFPKMANKLSKQQLSDLQTEAKAAGGKGVITAWVSPDGTWHSAIQKHMNNTEKENLIKTLQISDDDLILIAAGVGKEPLAVLGRLRNYVSQIMYEQNLLPEKNPQNFKFLWVVDFPLFAEAEPDSVYGKPGGLVAEHHPFTAPHPDDVHRIFSEPRAVRAQHYDIVVNGTEIGGGSIRIHHKKLQEKVMTDILNLSPQRLQTFQHLLTALSHGCPPHGGLALGLDRIVSIICQTPNLLSVIAFPKTGSGVEPMTGSPSYVTKEQLDELFLQIKST